MQPREGSSRADWAALHGLLFFALAAGTVLLPELRGWPVLWLVPLVAYGVIVAVVPKLRETFRPWRFGRVSRLGILGALILGGGASAVLVVFDRVARPDVSGYAGFLPVSALGGLMMVGIIFSVLNALLEEVIFRGILWDAIEAQWGVRGAWFATALLFGYSHLHGYPPGTLGAVMAAIFALGLGWLRIFTGGLGLAVLTHVTADATIYVLVARAGGLAN